jgi:hypothetical protein
MAAAYERVYDTLVRSSRKPARPIVALDAKRRGVPRGHAVPASHRARGVRGAQARS